ncbi:Glutamine amidotransferase subunit PdxT [Sporomusa ovata DSM 2662]|uniref:Pyridoxal 5'-phosphate synthase subunit PdxT n=1 Tax=Sporomusa ovata TaxID=2378 RepID=A0A0U1KV54_9FIRM|nr:glutamine amidotransferase subunit PdxT [Sporomusa ovata DSM 2662]CQR70783.1 Pyridoxine biosynthesis glutamine amidotransferase, glutaminase subunit [Sporomusa ovata]
MLTIGVLALQGAVQEHLDCLHSLPGVTGIAVKKAADLNGIDGLILPGGESTAIGKLLQEFQLTPLLIAKIRAGLPVWGTCAGMILLAKTIVDQPSCHLGLMDITVQRNAYGSQLNSFTTNALIPAVSSAPLPLVFIRAPYVAKAGPNVKVLATVADKIVAVEQGNMLATAFHPELTGNLEFHKYFVAKTGKQKITFS